MIPRISQLAANLWLITLNPPINGFDDFIGVYVYKGDKTVLIDTGPAVTGPSLLSAFETLGAGDPDYILLTHIHLDHAGAVGDLANAFPRATIVCHKSAILHLIDPEKLWRGTVKTLGSTGKAYGQITPVGASRILDADQFVKDGIQVIHTPGHAVHHVSYYIDPFLFTGEAAGVHLTLESGADYMRPATPPKFFLDITLKSIDRLEVLTPKYLCFGHHGMVADGKFLLDRHRQQLLCWRQLIEPLQSAGKEIDFILKALLRQDPCLAGFDNLPRDVKEREMFFLKNSINGYLGYLQAVSK